MSSLDPMFRYRQLSDWGDAADEGRLMLFHALFKVAYRRRRPRRSRSTLSRRPHTRRCWPSPCTSSRRDLREKKGATRSHACPHPNASPPGTYA